jgi:D-sedoheptulose 7-phosphate isomerase
MLENIISQISDLTATIKALDITNINQASIVLADCLKNGNKILLCGNGGSAADCQHFAAEMVIRFRASVNRPALPAIALTCDTSILTAGGNDIGFDNIFAQQVSALGNKNDILIGISTSGTSKNVINAIQIAKEKEMKVVGLLGKEGGSILNMCDTAVVVNHNTTARIQEAHILIDHIWCDLIERQLFPKQF